MDGDDRVRGRRGGLAAARGGHLGWGSRGQRGHDLGDPVDHRENGWPEEKGGVEWPVTLILMATATAVLGPGRLSIDHALGLDTRLDGGVGMLAAVGGVAAGVAQITVLWRKPEPAAPDAAAASA